jgi:hypothetical protein
VLVVVLAWLVGFGMAAAYQAVRRRRNPVWWAVLGAILGPIALLILHRAPPGVCASCGARTIGWSTICAWCGEDVSGAAAAPTAAPAAAVANRGPARASEPEDEAQVSAPTPLTVIQGTGPERRRPAAQTARETDADPAADGSPPAAAAAAASAGPVHRLRSVLGSAAPAEAASQASEPKPDREEADPDLDSREIVLASAIYVTGSRGLQAGSRYGIALVGTNLAIMGPVDVDPSAIVVLRPLRGLDATGAQNQLIITADDGFRGKFAMVFMALAGGTPERVAQIIVTAASAEAMAR